jgi:hypothetical protein
MRIHKMSSEGSVGNFLNTEATACERWQWWDEAGIVGVLVVVSRELHTQDLKSTRTPSYQNLTTLLISLASLHSPSCVVHYCIRKEKCLWLEGQLRGNWTLRENEWGGISGRSLFERNQPTTRTVQLTRQAHETIALRNEEESGMVWEFAVFCVSVMCESLWLSESGQLAFRACPYFLSSRSSFVYEGYQIKTRRATYKWEEKGRQGTATSLSSLTMAHNIQEEERRERISDTSLSFYLSLSFS